MINFKQKYLKYKLKIEKLNAKKKLVGGVQPSSNDKIINIKNEPITTVVTEKWTEPRNTTNEQKMYHMIPNNITYHGAPAETHRPRQERRYAQPNARPIARPVPQRPVIRGRPPSLIPTPARRSMNPNFIPPSHGAPPLGAHMTATRARALALEENYFGFKDYAERVIGEVTQHYATAWINSTRSKDSLESLYNLIINRRPFRPPSHSRERLYQQGEDHLNAVKTSEEIKKEAELIEMILKDYIDTASDSMLFVSPGEGAYSRETVGEYKKRHLHYILSTIINKFVKDRTKGKLEYYRDNQGKIKGT